MSTKSLIALVHAIPDSMPAAISAFKSDWPEADLTNIVDESLFMNLTAGTSRREEVVQRFRSLTQFALSPSTDGRRPDALLYCCSAFAYAIVQARLGIQMPVLTPAEAGIEQALECGNRIGLVVTAEAALKPLVDEFADLAGAKNQKYELVPIIAKGAIEALRAGRPEEHDHIVASAIASATAIDVVLMGQFTMSRAAAVIPLDPRRPVLTTPGSAVRKLRALLGKALQPTALS